MHIILKRTDFEKYSKTEIIIAIGKSAGFSEEKIAELLEKTKKFLGDGNE
jgi:hypothetical protein